MDTFLYGPFKHQIQIVLSPITQITGLSNTLIISDKVTS